MPAPSSPDRFPRADWVQSVEIRDGGSPAAVAAACVLLFLFVLGAALVING